MMRLHKKVVLFSAVVIGLFVLWTLVPMIFLAMQSFKPRLLMFADPPQFIFKPIANHYIAIFTKNDIPQLMKNSLIVSSCTTLICLVIGTMSAYALSSLNMPYKNSLAFIIIATRMIPVGTLMVPIYFIMRMLGLANTYLAIILAHTVINLSFAIWMMRSFFDDVPKELEQAAMVDGCSRIQSFVKISLPLAAAGLAATGILIMLNSWNEFMFALILSNNSTRTLPIGIASFLGVTIDWGGSAAAAVVSCVPIFIAGIFIQKYLVRGLTMGAIKG